MRRHYVFSSCVLALMLGGGAIGAACPADDVSRTREQKILQIQGLIQNRNLTEADRLLTEASKQYPADSGFDNLRGISAAQQGNYVSAEKHFRQAIRRSPKFTNAYLNLGRLYQEHAAEDPQALQKALDVYRHVLAYDAKNPEVNYQSADLLLRLGEYQKSLDRLAQLPTNIQSTAQTLSIACADYAALGNRKAADETAAQLAATPDFSEADATQVLPGLTSGKRGDLAISLLTVLQNRQPLSPAMQRRLGLAYERLDKLPEARAALEKSVTKETLSVGLLLDLARVARKQKDSLGALGYLAHARDLEPTNAKLHYAFGLVCVDMNLVAEARNSFEKAVALEPENPSYNYAMAAASVYRHDPAEAVPYFEKYLKLNPADSRAKLALADAFFRAKDYDAAIPWLTEAAKSPEAAPPAHYYLGAIALQQRRPEEALRELSLALKAKPDYADALAELGQYYVLQKDYAHAEQQIRRALELDPDHFQANFYLLTLYTRTADPRQEKQARRFDELQKRREQQMQDFLRVVEVRPLDAP